MRFLAFCIGNKNKCFNCKCTEHTLIHTASLLKKIADDDTKKIDDKRFAGRCETGLQQQITY